MLKIQENVDTQILLKKMIELDNSSIDLFEVSHPSLHDIFLRIAGADAQVPTEDVAHA